MKRKHENAVYFFAILGLIIVAAVVFSPNFPEGAKVSEGERSVEVDVLSSPEEAQNLAGEAFSGRITCSDSDGGKKYYQVGYVSGYRWISGKYAAYKYFDKCITSGEHKGELKEWYCDGNKPTNIYKNCPYGCENVVVERLGTSIGKCKPEPQEVCTCTDSDGGNYPYEFGNVQKECKSEQTSSIVLKRDECMYCTGLAPEPVTCGAVVEYYCYNNDIQSETHVCEYGCSNGACIKEPQIECTDSDSGKAYYTKGTTIGMSYPSGTITNETDFCSSDLILHEFSCYYNITTNIVVETEWNCPYGCQDGACIQEPQITCTDSDGENYYILGYVTYVVNGISETFYDNCIYWNTTDPKSNGYLEERVCRDGKYDTVAYSCPNGCNNGVCICPANCSCTNTAMECLANQTVGCYDSDGRVNPYVGGSCTDSRGIFYDGCLTQDGTKSEGSGAYVYETFCLTDEMVEHCKQYNSVEYCDNLPRQCYGVSLLPTPGLAWTYFDRDEKYFCANSCINGTCVP